VVMEAAMTSASNVSTVTSIIFTRPMA